MWLGYLSSSDSKFLATATYPDDVGESMTRTAMTTEDEYKRCEVMVLHGWQLLVLWCVCVSQSMETVQKRMDLST